MTVKEILSSCATCLGREEIVKYLNNTAMEVHSETVNSVATMVSLLNMVLCELASTYVPMVKTEKITFTNGRFLIASLQEYAIEIQGLYDDYGQNIYYKTIGEFISSSASQATICYHYVPNNYDLEDTIGYTEMDVSKMTLACGLAAEFSISEGSFNEAVMWHKRYVDGVSSVFKPKNARIKSRCWA